MKQYAAKALRLIKRLLGGGKGMLYNLWLRNRNRRSYNSSLLMRTYKVDIPKSTKLKGKVHLIAVKDASIKLGENVTLRSDPFDYLRGMSFGTTLLVDKSGAEIIIGDNCRLNGAYVHSKKRIRIGKNCVIAAGTNIIDLNGHELISSDRTTGEDTPKEIVIEDNVWICVNSVILKGTVIGRNSVVAANSVVKGIFPPNSLIQGNPAVVKSILPIES